MKLRRKNLERTTKEEERRMIKRTFLGGGGKGDNLHEGTGR